MSPVLECSAKLGSVQGELKIGFIVDSFCCRIIFNPAKMALLQLLYKKRTVLLG